MTSLDTRIQHALERLAATKVTDSSLAETRYIQAFQSSARGKAEAVLAALRQAEPPLNKLRPVFLSIGGGDGEELRTLLEQSQATHGILLEKKKKFADMAREKQALLPEGKFIEVFEGDAQRNLPDAINFAKTKIEQREGEFLAVSCHAIIHELHDRSDDEFDLPAFLGTIFQHDDFPVWFTSREPGVPEKWPEKILLRAHCKSESLQKLADAIATRHPDLGRLKPKAHILGDDIRLHKTLGMELLAKLFYLDDFEHEIDERSTAMDHAKFQSTLMLAIGETAVKDQRANATTISAATTSFQKNWQEFGIEARGLNENDESLRLTVAESQTRVLAWKIPAAILRHAGVKPQITPLPPSVQSQHTRQDVLIASEALSANDTALLEALCISRGRRWIESKDRANAILLLEKIKNSYPQNSFLACWAHYLLSLAALFSDKADLQMFPEGLEAKAAAYGLDKLFLAERMEFRRKLGKGKYAAEILEIANSLLPTLPVSVLASSTDLERYVIGTTKFVVANLFRSGGLYADAWAQMSAAEAIYKPNIESHATELAHCHYAKTICVAVTGLADFDLHITEGNTNREFAFALIELSYAHAAWFVGDVSQARRHADQAAKIFDEIESPHYAKRARTLGWLLNAWTHGSSGDLPPPPDESQEFAVCVRGLRGTQTDLSGITKWLSKQRPSTTLGLIQFAKDKQNWTTAVRVEVPATLHWGEDGKLAWRMSEEVNSVSELDSVLRRYLGISASKRIPLITD